jgi:predicted transcriptional regulator of viral defense system
MNREIQKFFRSNAVFRYEEFKAYCEKELGITKESTIKGQLAYSTRRGYLENLRRHLYISHESYHSPSPLVVAAKLCNDGVIAYHSALDFWGVSYSVYYSLYVLTNNPAKDFHWKNFTFKTIRFPTKLKDQTMLVEQKVCADQYVRVTSQERTLVDCLDKVALAGGWEELIESVDGIQYFRIDKCVEYALALGRRRTVTKLGYYLEANSDRLMVDEQHLKALENHVPKYPADLSGSKKGKYLKRWNIILPGSIVDRGWEDPGLSL